MKVDTMAFSHNLREILNAKNITNVELSKRLGLVHANNIAYWTRGKTMPNLISLCMIAKALDVSYDELLDGITE